MKRITLDKIASVTARIGLDHNAVLGTDIPAKAGSVIAARVLNAKTVYNTLEDCHGRMVILQPGDIVAGALGHRKALLGYSGQVPESVSVGDELQLLNLGGVIGTGASATPALGEPFRLEVLGSVLEFPDIERRVGRPACVGRAALKVPEPSAEDWANLPPIVALVGTSMNSGKTTAACALVAGLRQDGYSVGSGKLTGVSLRSDIWEMHDCGANPTAVFTDFGVVTTDANNAVAAAHSLIHYLASNESAPPDVLVLEFGDGLLGTYGVQALLEDEAIAKSISRVILCAQDPVGAWGGTELLRTRWGLSPDVICGRITDTPAGLSYCKDGLEVATWNALSEGPEVAQRLFPAGLRGPGPTVATAGTAT
ncbi:MAG: hypothetical protein ACI8QS_001611 [Planctomycetota bacterium]|jgi:hypothetical protein